MNLPNRSQVLAPVFAFLLVFSAFAGGVGVQPAAATHDCDNLDSLVFFASLTIANYDKCAQNHNTGDIDELRELQAEQTEQDIYDAAVNQKAATESQRAVYENYLNDTQSAAWMQAEIAIAEAYENGSSKALARSKAKQAIADYYAVKQRNLIESYNVSATATHVMAHRADNESNVSESFVDMRGSGLGDNVEITSGDYQDTYIKENSSTYTVELANGSSAVSKTIEYRGAVSNGGSTDTGTASAYVSGVDSDIWGGHDNAQAYVRVNPPNDNFDEVRFMQPSNYWDLWTRIETQNSALQDEAGAYVNATWDDYEAGTINSSDVISGHTAMFRYSDQTMNGSGDLYSSVAALSTLGLDTPELNGTGTMELMYNGATYHGLPMARNAPNGSWEANTTYNTSDIDGPVFMVTTGGDRIELDGEFTIGSISDTDGKSIEVVETRKVVYKSANTSEYLAMQEEISELRSEVEAKQQAVGDGSSSGPDIDPMYLLGALAVIGLLAYGKGQQSKGN
ncbi:hypothetical protein GRX01_06610 [Halobaculum sp. WSA2]|uniref:Envelope protein N-terminal domain-containing protein n=1 Tax=Halobaculum saliterrae TaxID=2073113 RepID=A0A6B0SXI8_9EURY|nr:hypothetical protein [Halobaculum saliterrae]MXR41012.1 hypothetical protein [Halobaculum saliterrae]